MRVLMSRCSVKKVTLTSCQEHQVHEERLKRGRRSGFFLPSLLLLSFCFIVVVVLDGVRCRR